MVDTGNDIARAAALLRAGELVAIPTETVYGLAGNAFDEEAVLKIFRVKNRPTFNPVIVHTDTLDKVYSFVRHMPRALLTLAEIYWPGPLTLLLPRQEIIPDLVTAGKARVAVRIPRHPMALSLLSQLDFPLAAPSANPFGYISPTTAAHVADQLGESIPYILDGGPTEVGLESTIVGLGSDGQIEMYRLGGISPEEIEAYTGPVRIRNHAGDDPEAAGMLQSHYAPRTPLVRWEGGEIPAAYRHLRLGVLAFREAPDDIDPAQVQVLSPKGSTGEAASRLFAALRYLDALRLDLILAEPAPDKGLGRAINDRLIRAEADRKPRNTPV
ncbi:MAG: L-threonylcarbamoyladenylate synthase [Bacteroidia bacterium]